MGYNDKFIQVLVLNARKKSQIQRNGTDMNEFYDQQKHKENMRLHNIQWRL